MFNVKELIKLIIIWCKGIMNNYIFTRTNLTYNYLEHHILQDNYHYFNFKGNYLNFKGFLSLNKVVEMSRLLFFTV